MKYSRFEALVIAVGGVAIVATLLLSLHGTIVVEEMVAQLLLLVVLVGAVHWGPKGGFLTAVLAVMVYIAMRSPLLSSQGITFDLLDLVLVRMGAYGAVGIIGGAVCGRIKYVFARFEGGNVDDDTHLYNQAYVGRLLAANISAHDRYKTPFSLVLVTISEALTSELKSSRRRSLLRSVANHIRDDVRLVDDVGRLSDNEFVIVLPHTPKTGGDVAARRITDGVRKLLGAREESVTCRVLGAPEDMTELEAICHRLTNASERAA